MAHHNDVHGEPIVREMLKNANLGFEALDRYGHLDALVEFEGPYVARVGEEPYVTFTQYGLKEEGASPYPDEHVRCWTAAEALWKFRRAFLDYLADRPALQLAWRSKPRLEQSPDGDYVVRCRFALLGKIEKPLRAVA